jgi:hypothetical protein
MGFGDAFVSAYNATSATIENKRRGLLLENADKRQQEEWEQKKKDWQETHDLAEQMAMLSATYTDEVTKRARESNAAVAAQAQAGPPPAQGANAAPPSPEPSAAAPPPAAPINAPPAASTTPPARTAAVGPPPVELNLTPDKMTPEILGSIALNRSRQYNIPLQQAMQDVTTAMKQNGPAAKRAAAVTPPGPTSNEGGLDAAGRGYAGSPPAAAPAPDAAPAAPVEPPMLTRRPAIEKTVPVGPAPDGSVATAPDTTPDPFIGSSGDTNFHIDAARDFTNKMIPLQIKMLAKTHPDQVVKLTQMMSDPVLQDRITKLAAFASMAIYNTSDPSLQKLLPSVDPMAVPGSWLPRAPDANGNQYAQYTRRMPDGSTVEVAVNPAEIKKMMISTLSPSKILDEGHKIDEEKRKDAEQKAQEQNFKDTRDYYNRHLLEVTRHDTAEEGIQAKHGEASVESAKATREGREAATEDRREARLQKGQESALKTVMQLTGYAEAAKLDPEGAASKLADVMAAMHGLGDANKIDLGVPQNVLRLKTAMDQITRGKSIVEKDGKFYYSTGDPDTTLLVPSFLLPGKPKSAPQQRPPTSVPRAAAITPP